MKRERRAALTGKTVGLSAVVGNASNDEGASAPKTLNDHMLATSAGLVPTAKAYFVGESGANESQALVEQDKSTKLLLSKGALEPAYPPNMLALVYENSSTLRQNVDAYVTNIDSFGHSYVPVIDVDDVSADERIRDAIRAERQAGIMSGATLKSSDEEIIKANKEPTDGDVETRKKQLRIEIRAERERLDSFFDNCTPTMPFSGPEGLRGLTRQDIEVFGYGYWEILRNRLGQISQFNRVDGRSVRLMPEDEKPTEVQIDRKISLLATEKVTVKKRFRRYVQTYEPGTQLVYFKEFGDPRCVDAKTGRYYKDLKTMTAAVKKDDPNGVVREATEIYPFKNTSVRGPYGVPRWIGTLLCVLGTRQSEEVNFLYFENKSVPPMAILVSGGRLNSDTVKRLEDYITNEIRGKRNFHKIMILEAEAGANADPSVSGKMKITLQPLTDAQQKDALFQGYDERNSDKVGQAFRLPRILRGDIRDFNRSCYSEDTETLTETGWKTHDQIGPEEKIAGYDKETGEVRFVVPDKKLVYDVKDQEMIHVHNQHTDCLVTPDHRMLVRAVGAEKWDVQLAGEISYSRFQVPVSGRAWNGVERTQTFVLPKTCMIERGHEHPSEIAFDDWLEFVGYFISEGGLLMTDHPSAPYLVYIDQKKPGTREKMRACFDRIGWNYSTQIKSCGTTHFLFSNRCLRDWIVNNIGTNSFDWKIPNEYLSLGIRQLQILFDALMAGDGTWSLKDNDDHGGYYSVHDYLVGQVQRLCIQLGLRSQVRFSPGASCWRAMISPHETTEVKAREQERSPCGVDRIPGYTGKVYCFSVPEFGFFVTRHNGKTAIQGNTAEAALDFAELQVFGPLRQDFDWRMNKLILPSLGIKYHTFRSNAPTIRDPQALSDILVKMTVGNILTPGEARDIAEQVFNRALTKIKAPWTDQPIGLSLIAQPIQDNIDTPDDETTEYGKPSGGVGAGLMSTPGAGGPAQRATGAGASKPAGTSKPTGMKKSAMSQVASGLQKIHARLLDAEREEWDENRAAAEVIKVPYDLMRSWIRPDPKPADAKV